MSHFAEQHTWPNMSSLNLQLTTYSAAAAAAATAATAVAAAAATAACPLVAFSAHTVNAVRYPVIQQNFDRLLKAQLKGIPQQEVEKAKLIALPIAYATLEER
jgi:phosphopantothenoylcysteine synthetase/decarboxylase